MILRQQEAFRHDDAAGAYAEAAPAIRSIFGSPETFIGMVRQGYGRGLPQPPLRVRHRRGPARRKPRAGGAHPGPGRHRLGGALYTLERDGDGAWRITGCRLRKAPGASA